MEKRRLFACLCCVLVVIFVTARLSMAQQKKGDFEVLFLSGNFGFNPGTEFVFSGPSGTQTVHTPGSQSFSVSGNAGYFVTRKNEVGGGLGLSVFHDDHSCIETITSGSQGGPTTTFSCTSGFWSASVGLNGFYRYNFAREDSRRFPFVGIEIAVADLVHRDFTGNVTARPSVGYKYFLKKSVALDFSVGYRMDVNEFKDSGFFQARGRSVDGQIGLAFVF